MWWEVVKQEPSYVRKRDECMHWTKGHHTEWEDVLVLAYGLAWRTFRDNFHTLNDWMGNLTHFVNTVCASWGLPAMAAQETVPDLPLEPATKRRRLRTLDQCPPNHSHKNGATAYSWHSCGRHFIFVVDCEPMQKVLCGYSPLAAPELTKVFERTVANVGSILGEGWLPPRPWEDPVQWQRRENNVIADFLVNYTMDAQMSWEKVFEWPFENHDLHECNFAVHSDGGTRMHRCSATGFIVEAGVLTAGLWCYKPLVMGGTYIPSPVSPFCTEILALEESSLCLKRLLTSLGKRPRHNP